MGVIATHPRRSGSNTLHGLSGLQNEPLLPGWACRGSAPRSPPRAGKGRHEEPRFTRVSERCRALARRERMRVKYIGLQRSRSRSLPTGGAAFVFLQGSYSRSSPVLWRHSRAGSIARV